MQDNLINFITVITENCSKIKKVVINTNDWISDVNLIDCNGQVYGAVSNTAEPFDFRTHVFYLPENCIKGAFTLTYSKDNNIYQYVTNFDNLEFANKEDLIKKYDNNIEIISEEEHGLTDGVSYKILTCQNNKNLPVKAFAFLLKKGYYSFEVGTANDGYQKNNATATVEEQAKSRIKNGQYVIGATNADFFDIFNDCAPSGLCVKNSKIVANGNSMRNFFGFTKNGDCVIGNFIDNPELYCQLHSAVGGREIFLKDGKVNDFSAGEPFSYVTHPRTSVGIKENGDAIVLVVDGRNPTYSNGASIIDLARIMQKLGAKDAINLDGGGSSIFIVNTDSGFKILNRPADLLNPKEFHVRPIFNSIQIVVDKK